MMSQSDISGALSNSPGCGPRAPIMRDTGMTSRLLLSQEPVPIQHSSANLSINHGAGCANHERLKDLTKNCRDIRKPDSRAGARIFNAGQLQGEQKV
jgi:hypothetical protein